MSTNAHYAYRSRFRGFQRRARRTNAKMIFFMTGSYSSGDNVVISQ